jgi:hypothetical protein
LAYVTGTVDQELLLRNEYLAAENRILKAQLKGRLQLSDAERATLGEIGRRLGRKVLGEVANVARPDTILAWYRKLVSRKFDGSGSALASVEAHDLLNGRLIVAVGRPDCRRRLRGNRQVLRPGESLELGGVSR